ncbi:hypothetical protein XENTR_v10012593 [Xenopus tropicalis]|uniref:Uncharacterized protein LOC116410455 n=1 Tax=Xenopus tropicalis TaxID=8364 RepID=A0A8J1JIX0_XENTR|nr:uncharacterized protein LOC116410455 [Xenopus tropicalis]KAE8611763.1 hypothetical protein XENTR_v10012593 [Xenopus tropicalis]KAE8611764.1 hypothetical protein XENTR_v10012593 [Xenopus tropicalis]
MSEKLRRCRKEFSEAISRVLENSGLPYFIHLHAYHYPAGYMKSVPTKSIVCENVVTMPFCVQLHMIPEHPFSHPPEAKRPGQHSLSLDLEQTPQSSISSFTDSQEDITGTLLELIESTNYRVMAKTYETVESEVDLSILYGLCPGSPSYGATMPLVSKKAAADASAVPAPLTDEEDCRIIEMVLDMEEDYCCQTQTCAHLT